MNKIILKQGEEIFIEGCDIKYILYANTPVFVSDKVYFSDDDNFFHFSKELEKPTSITDDFNKLINDIKSMLGLCIIEQSSKTESSNLDNKVVEINNSSNNIDDKLWVEIKKGTIIKMNNLPVTLGIDMLFYIKPSTNFMIPSYSHIEMVSRNNIIKIINKENIECKFSKIL